MFLSGSYVHQKWLEVQRNMYDGVSRELQRLSDTRWACRHVACRNVMDRLPAIFKFKFKFKLSFIVIPLHVGTYSGTKCRASQVPGAT